MKFQRFLAVLALALASCVTDYPQSTVTVELIDGTTRTFTGNCHWYQSGYRGPRSYDITCYATGVEVSIPATEVLTIEQRRR